ncbi:MAG TPA: lysophospholipid acyltransferase family protein [Beijerinckiaceae bacterium]|nr:lysophospholipid acyltransferase family protein [Beijerinckiaceae bacterium]
MNLVRSGMGSRELDREAERALERRSPLVFGFFVRIFRRTFSRDFHALRVSRRGLPPEAATPRLVLFSNHPSWWDAVACVLLAQRFFPGRAAFAPIHADMLKRYPFMGRIGAFGIEPEGRAGGAAFLAGARRILADPEGLLLVTAQGRFADARERPVRLRPGIAHVAALQPDATFVPLALDYVFWDERKPELLVRFGAPIPAASLAHRPVAERTDALARALEETMNALTLEAMTRDPAAFDILFAGRVGVGGVYDAWRRTRAALKGERFSPAHGDER